MALSSAPFRSRFSWC